VSEAMTRQPAGRRPAAGRRRIWWVPVWMLQGHASGAYQGVPDPDEGAAVY